MRRWIFGLLAVLLAAGAGMDAVVIDSLGYDNCLPAYSTSSYAYYWSIDGVIALAALTSLYFALRTPKQIS